MPPAVSGEIEPPLVAWLGDDFTGAAAVMEVLAFSGHPAILFLQAPTPDQLARAGKVAGIGIATLARAQSPEWMDRHLPPLFALLDATGAGLVHYKICSTLDSSPRQGSIGRAIELGRARFGPAAVPVVTAAPQIRRYQAFGTLFAAAPDGVHRLDRHPVMARHPVTPMGEADVARHLAAQTDLPTGCLTVEDLGDLDAAARRMARDRGIWTVDMMTSDDEARVGQLLWTGRSAQRFVVGSQGVEYALVAHWRASGRPSGAGGAARLDPADRMAVVSGSVSAISAAQIQWAAAHGFRTIRLDATDVVSGGTAAQAATEKALEALSQGASPLVYSALGPDDPSVLAVRQAAGGDMDLANARIGAALGQVLAAVVRHGAVRRVAVSGGDTSGHVCAALGIMALRAVAPTIPGAAICRAVADGAMGGAMAGAMDGLEIALKGGQMGTPDYFGWVRDGGGPRP